MAFAAVCENNHLGIHLVPATLPNAFSPPTPPLVNGRWLTAARAESGLFGLQKDAQSFLHHDHRMDSFISLQGIQVQV